MLEDIVVNGDRISEGFNYQSIIHGAIGGLLISFSGFAKSNERFNYKKMIPTMVTSTAIGAIAGYLGLDYGIVANSSMSAGLTLVTENIFKSIYRKSHSTLERR